MKHYLAPPPCRGRTPLFISLLCASLLCGAFVPAAALAGGRAKASRQKGARKPAARTKNRLPPVPPPARAQAPGGSELEDDAEARSDWFMSKRTFPFDSIPAGARRRAWEAAARAPKAKDRFGLRADGAAERQVWAAVGPRPTVPPTTPKNWGGTSGRINSVAVSPADARVILVGSATGGIWRSADGGANFAPVSDNQIDLPVSWIAFAPGSPSTVYAAMGDIDSAYLGSGVLKSFDAGQTWSRVSNSTLPDGVAARLAVDPSNAQRVYVAQNTTKDRSTNATLASGFFVSTDGGVNWTRTFAGQMRDLVLHPSNPQIIYATVGTRGFATAELGNPPGLYRSNDAGHSWSPVQTPATGFRAPLYDFRIAIAPTDPQRIYIYVGSILSDERQLYYSRDGGASWLPAFFFGVDTGQFGYNTYLEVDPTNAETVYLGSRDVWKSTDGGVNWVNLTQNFVPSGNGGWSYQPGMSSLHPDQQAFAFEPGNPSVVYLGNDGGLWKSSDGGHTVQSLNRTLSLVQFTSLAIHPTDPGFTIGGTQDNGTQRRLRDASGLPSVGWDVFAGSDGGACFFNVTNPAILYGTYFSAWVNRFRVSGPSIVFDKQIGTYSTWGESTTNTRIAFYPPFTGNGVNQRIYFGSWRLFVSDNLGDTWSAPAGFTDLTHGGTDTLSTIAVSSSDTATIYTGSGRGRAMVSRNGGATWADITAGLPQRFIEKIVVDPADPATAYLAVSGFGTGHVFKTTNAGAAWADVSGNLPNIPTNALLIDPLNRNVIYAGTDVGVFRSAAAGGAWEYFSDGLPPAPVSAFAAQASGRIQLATYGRGAYELTTVPVGPSSVSFAAAPLSVSEGTGFVRLTVTRSGDLSLPARVDYATSGGTADDRADFTAAYGTLRFAADETTRTLDVFVTDDRFAEGPESFMVALSNAAGVTLGAAPTATVNLLDNDAVTGANPVRWDSGFDTQFFVRQHYIDFFNREPDAPGLAHWTNVIDSCGADNLCREARRVNVSAAFFLSIEFQETGFVVYLAHQAAFETAERLRLKDFLADVREIGRGVVVNQGDWKGQIESNRTAFFDEFVTRPAFASKFGALSNAQYVDALNAGAGNSLTQGERDALVAGLNAATLTRARALRSVVENPAFGRGHYNRAFVLMQYFGYLRRNPDDAPEQNRDFAGFNHWLTNLNNFNGNFEQAEMVKAFITSEEYQRRFGP